MIVTEYEVGPGAYGVALGADGAAWTSLTGRGELARVGPDGQVSRVSLDSEQSRPMVLARGPDDAIWFSRGDGQIGRADPAGTVTRRSASSPGLNPTGSRSARTVRYGSHWRRALSSTLRNLNPKPALARPRSGFRRGPGYGFQREVDDLAAVHLLAPFDAEAEFGVGEVLVQQRRRLAQAVGVGAEGRRATAG